MAHSFPLILVPSVAGTIFTGVALPIFVGEIMSCFWLMFKSVSIIARAIDLQSHNVKGWGLLFSAGILGVIFSFFILFNPEIGAGTLVLLTSFAFAVIGAFYIMMGLKLKNAHEWRKV